MSLIDSGLFALLQKENYGADSNGVVSGDRVTGIAPRGKVMAAYLGLSLMALAIPLLHTFRTSSAIEAMRPMMRLEDGSWSPMLMPAPILLLRWMGELSWCVAFGVLIAFMLSFPLARFARPAMVCLVAMSLCFFTTVYAVYATLLLGSYWSGGK